MSLSVWPNEHEILEFHESCKYKLTIKLTLQQDFDLHLQACQQNNVLQPLPQTSRCFVLSVTYEGGDCAVNFHKPVNILLSHSLQNCVAI